MVTSRSLKTGVLFFAILLAMATQGCASPGAKEGSVKSPVASFRLCSGGGGEVHTYGLETLKNPGPYTVKLNYIRPKKADGAEIIGARIVPKDTTPNFGIGSATGYPPTERGDETAEKIHQLWRNSFNFTDAEIPPRQRYHLFIGVYAPDFAVKPARIEGILIGYTENGRHYEVEAPATFTITDKSELCGF